MAGDGNGAVRLALSVGGDSIQQVWRNPVIENYMGGFIKQGNQIFVVEVKGDEEIADPYADNIKKHEYATDHFKRLNQWLEKAKIPTRYQFNMISPKSYNVFFQKLRDGGVIGFRSDLDVAMTNAAKAGS